MLFLASMYKQYKYNRRYIFNTIFNIVLFTVIFAALIFGYSSLSSSPLQYGSSVSGLMVSYFAWTLMLSVYTSTGYVVEQNKNNGTLENIILASQSITAVLIFESIANSVWYFVFSWAIIGILSLICSVQLYIHVLTVFVVLIVGLLSVLGLSLVVAGLEMIFRKMSSILSLLQFVLLGGLFLPDMIASRVLMPFYMANTLLKKTFLEDGTLLTFAWSDCLLLLFNSALYLLFGILCFQAALNYAKRKGTLAFY